MKQNYKSERKTQVAQAQNRNDKSNRKLIFFHGPESGRNKEGDEIPVWAVYVGTETGEPLGTCYTIHAYHRAAKLANLMSHDRQLELINEAQPA